MECRASAPRATRLVPARNLMAYSEFTLESVERLLGVTTGEADLFPNSPTAPVPDWLRGNRAGNRQAVAGAGLAAPRCCRWCSTR
jgi:hypothetical protein